MAEIDVNALKSEVRNALINRKANACPIAMRLAWHSSGTYDKSADFGGSDGATMRFAPESTDDANAGLGIVRDLLLPIKKRHPEISYADLWTFAGKCSIEFLGGPQIPHKFGRGDAANGSACPVNGLLPDASQGAQHLRDVFYRQGFNDQEIVALAGAHTLGNCHVTRSGYDGPWTPSPLKFDNQYFKVLLRYNWVLRDWDGPDQFEDTLTRSLMMLPTDMALKTDPEFRKYAEIYAADEQKFFTDFAAAFAKLISNGCPAHVNPENLGGKSAPSSTEEASAAFRKHAMHGSVGAMRKELAKGAEVDGVEGTSGRTALHKAAFWGHIDTIKFLLHDCKSGTVNATDYNGDTPLHDAARFGHLELVQELLSAGARPQLVNKLGQDVAAVATAYDKTDVLDILARNNASKL